MNCIAHFQKMVVPKTAKISDVSFKPNPNSIYMKAVQFQFNKVILRSLYYKNSGINFSRY